MIDQKTRIYVAGPYTKGDVAENVSNAIDAANRLADLGFAPFVPHLTHFWHLKHQRPYDFWLELDKTFLTTCDALLRLPGESKGADEEVALANELDIPVFTNIEELANAYNFELEEEKIIALVNRLDPPQEWYDEMDELFDDANETGEAAKVQPVGDKQTN